MSDNNYKLLTQGSEKSSITVFRVGSDGKFEAGAPETIKYPPNMANMSMVLEPQKSHKITGMFGAEEILTMPSSYFIPSKFKVTDEILNQEHCGSCWAFSTSSVMSDRWAITNKASEYPFFSPLQTLICTIGSQATNGCLGGLPEFVGDFYENRGAIKSNGTSGDLSVNTFYKAMDNSNDCKQRGKESGSCYNAGFESLKERNYTALCLNNKKYHHYKA